MVETGVLSDKDAVPLLDDVAARADEVNLINHSLMASMLKWLLHKKR